MRAATGSPRYRAGELAADAIIHLAGILVGVVGSVALVGIAAGAADRATLSASVVYSVSLLAMLGSSAAYNLAIDSPRRGLLRRIDHAAIFLMIAGTYTPFTTCRLHGAWAIGMTAAVWIGALTGGIAKLVAPRRIEQVSIVAYLTLGWMILVGARPMLAAVDARTALFIGAGGVLYSIGVGFHRWWELPFHRAIWHGFVLVAAGCHYAAILYGVVLARS